MVELARQLKESSLMVNQSVKQTEKVCITVICSLRPCLLSAVVTSVPMGTSTTEFILLILERRYLNYFLLVFAVADPRLNRESRGA
jgi:hypothetical protein